MDGASRVNIDLASALAEVEREYVAARPKSQAQAERAGKSMPGGNTRTVLFYGPFPAVIDRGEGPTLIDIDGNRYIDFLGEYTAGLYGHSHPVIMQVLHETLDKGVSFGGPNVNEAELSRLVCERFPSVELVRFTNSGTEGNIMALGTARAFTGREKILGIAGGYHGGVLYFGSGAPSPINAPYPFVLAPYNDIEGTRALMRQHAAELAAIIVEPMIGNSGIPADVDYLKMLREEATAHGIVLIFDEVMTSRLSPGGLQLKHGITPDMTTFGKYIGGGMSFGAFGGRGDIMRRYDPRQADAWPHAGTFNNNVLTMAAGVAGLTKIYTPQKSIELSARGDAFRAKLNAIGAKAGVPLMCTGMGSINVVHFQRTPLRRPADAGKTPIEARALFQLSMLGRGYYIARRGFSSLSVVLEPQHYDGFHAAVEAFCEEYRSVLQALDG
ncbi:MAG: aminotransferase class III-fold pyridoxal phosphate-dependent enzyme [Alphaproteobacteria bacterium]|nr:aminotransferase class III-fold pyridoxal phosphate-dependent enzyme [Alphaproteobacteria bacterium]MCW5739349.1 aminotransferase class III-fold pyridoxal phosphate-dependent enzyme [Alphaproteobacteria bacterium]